MTRSDKALQLRALAYLNGAACTAIGITHVLKGSDAGPGLGGASASEDSQEAFYGAVFAAYGASWLWTARQQPIQPTPVRLLAGTMALGGVGRVLSIRRRGLPHPFWVAMAAVEFAVPGLFALWADADLAVARNPA